MTATNDRIERWTHLASVLAGRAMTVSVSADISRPWTEAHRMVLVEGPPDNIRTQVVAQAALVAAGTFDPEVLRALARRPSLAERYLHFEARRAASLMAARWPILTLHLPEVSGPATSSADESLARAKSRESVDPAGWAWGELRIRQAVAAGQRTSDPTPTSAADSGRTYDVDPPGESSIFGRWGSFMRRARLGGQGGTPVPGATTAPQGGFLVDSGGAEAAGRRSARVQKRTQPRPPAHVQMSAHEYRYPEWDRDKRRYREAWCAVHERVSLRGQPLDLTAPTGRLRRDLAPLGLGMRPEGRRVHGDEVDLDAIICVRVALAAAEEPSPHVYVDRVRTRRDLSVLVLVDISGSARDKAPDGHTVHTHQQAAAAALVEALEGLGDRTAIYGFRSRGRDDVTFVCVKSFNDRFDRRARHRLGGLQARANSRIGAGIRHGAHLLRTEGGTTNQLLVLLSDGFAHDDGYEGGYGRADARMALIEARARGAACLSLTIGASDDDKDLEAVFGSSAHARADSVAELVPRVRELFFAALLQAGRRPTSTSSTPTSSLKGLTA